METVFGIHVIKQLLETKPRQITALYMQATAMSDNRRLQDLMVTAERLGVPIKRCSKQELDQYANRQHHQGVVAICQDLLRAGEFALPDLLAREKKSSRSILLLILDGIQDPHNLGACLRSANALGAVAVIAPKDKAVGITPVVRKVACGAEQHTPFVPVTNLARTLRALQEEGIWLVGTDADAKQSLFDIDLTGHIGIVLGSEGSGLRQLTQKHCDFAARIPLRGQVESLNVSVAAGICLYEVQRQRAAGIIGSIK